jgi:DNA-binding SARP family transcriptional activator
MALQGRKTSGVKGGRAPAFCAATSSFYLSGARDAGSVMNFADALWPESEGDRAIRNLHAATYDLRRVLAEIPGARLSVADGRYELQLGASVSVE